MKLHDMRTDWRQRLGAVVAQLGGSDTTLPIPQTCTSQELRAASTLFGLPREESREPGPDSSIEERRMAEIEQAVWQSELHTVRLLRESHWPGRSDAGCVMNTDWLQCFGNSIVLELNVEGGGVRQSFAVLSSSRVPALLRRIHCIPALAVLGRCVLPAEKWRALVAAGRLAQPVVCRAELHCGNTLLLSMEEDTHGHMPNGEGASTELSESSGHAQGVVWDDLELSAGSVLRYVHLDNVCEHVICVHTIREACPQDSSLFCVPRYALHENKTTIAPQGVNVRETLRETGPRRRCDVCATARAQWLVTGCASAPSDLAFVCALCFETLAQSGDAFTCQPYTSDPLPGASWDLKER